MESPEQRAGETVRPEASGCFSLLKARPVYFATLGLVAIAAAPALVVACLVEALPDSWPAAAGSLPLLRLAAAALAILVAVGAAHVLAIHAERRFTTSWWDPANSFDAQLEWSDVYRLVVCDMRNDPLGFERRPRWRGCQGWRWRSLLYLLAALALWGVVLSALDLAYDPRPRDFMLVPKDRTVAPGLAAVIGNPTAYLALLAAVVTIIFTYYQLRAKVRADSRQQWIIRARELIGQVVALTDDFRDLRDKQRFADAEAMWNRMNPLRLELELMLNPSEKDHRLLLHLIQRFALRRRVAGPIQDEKILREAIEASVRSDPKITMAAWSDILDAKRREDQVSYILRLSHVVLKREWERVKHTR